MRLQLQIANAPCSWGVLEFEEQSAAGYDYTQVLDELRAAGYVGTELGDWGFMPTDPRTLRDALGERSLSLVGAFVPIRLADPGARAEGERAAIRTASLLKDAGFPTAFVVLADDIAASPERTAAAGRVGPEHQLPDDDRAVFAANAEGIARAVSEATGLRTVFHHHCASYIETAEEITDLMRRTSPEVLGLCLDTGHMSYAGADPEQVVTELGSRIWHLHLKDCSPGIAERARTEEGDILHPPHAFLDQRVAVVGAEGHAENHPALPVVERRHLVQHLGALEHDQRIGRCHNSPLCPAESRHQPCRRQAVGASVDDR